MSTRARWIAGIPDLYGRLNEAGRYLTVAEVSNETSFSVTTLEDALSRPPITKEGNPLGALSRPAARIGTKPLYSPEQVEEAKRRMQGSGHRHLGGGDEQLPRVSAEEALKRGYLSTADIAELADKHEQTVRRWSRDDASFPPAVALMSRGPGNPGVPIVMREGGAVEKWLSEKEKVGA